MTSPTSQSSGDLSSKIPLCFDDFGFTRNGVTITITDFSLFKRIAKCLHLGGLVCYGPFGVPTLAQMILSVRINNLSNNPRLATDETTKKLSQLARILVEQRFIPTFTGEEIIAAKTTLDLRFRHLLPEREIDKPIPGRNLLHATQGPADVLGPHRMVAIPRVIDTGFIDLALHQHYLETGLKSEQSGEIKPLLDLLFEAARSGGFTHSQVSRLVDKLNESIVFIPREVLTARNKQGKTLFDLTLQNLNGPLLRYLLVSLICQPHPESDRVLVEAVLNTLDKGISIASCEASSRSCSEQAEMLFRAFESSGYTIHLTPDEKASIEKSLRTLITNTSFLYYLFLTSLSPILEKSEGSALGGSFWPSLPLCPAHFHTIDFYTITKSGRFHLNSILKAYIIERALDLIIKQSSNRMPFEPHESEMSKIAKAFDYPSMLLEMGRNFMKLCKAKSPGSFLSLDQYDHLAQSDYGKRLIKDVNGVFGDSFTKAYGNDWYFELDQYSGTLQLVLPKLIPNEKALKWYENKLECSKYQYKLELVPEQGYRINIICPAVS